MERVQLHPSGISVFTECGERFRRRYLVDDDEPWSGRSTYLIVGSALDASVSSDLLEKIRTGELLPEDEAVDIARDSVEMAFTGKVDVPLSARHMAMKECVSRATRFAQYAHRKLSPNINPKAVQRSWSMRLDTFLRNRGLRGMKIDYVGTMDIEEHVYGFVRGESEPQPIGTIIRDIKTSRKSPPGDAADGKHWVQMTSYALGKMVEDHEMPQYVQIDTLVDLVRGVEHKPSRGERDDLDIAALFNRLETVARSLRTGIFMPAPKDHWRCSKKWCEFYDSCPYTKNQMVLDLKVPNPKLYQLRPLRPEPQPEPPKQLRRIIRKENPECLSQPRETSNEPSNVPPSNPE